MNLVTLDGEIHIVASYVNPDRPIGSTQKLIRAYPVLMTPEGKIFKGMIGGDYIVPKSNFYEGDLSLYPCKVITLHEQGYPLYRYQVGQQYLRRDQVRYVDKNLNPLRYYTSYKEYSSKEKEEIAANVNYDLLAEDIKTYIEEEKEKEPSSWLSRSLNISRYLDSDPDVPIDYYGRNLVKNYSMLKGFSIRWNASKRLEIYGYIQK